MTTRSFSQLERRLLGEVADAAFIGLAGGITKIEEITGPYVAHGLQELFNDRWYPQECTQQVIDELKQKVLGLSAEEAVNLLDETKGQRNIKWVQCDENLA